MARIKKKQDKTPKPLATPKAKRGKKGQVESNTWWEQSESVPREGVPAVEKMNKRQGRWRLFIYAILILFPLSLASNFAMFASADNTAAAPVSAEAAYADTRGAAIIAVRQWLSSTPAPLPDGVFVSWDRATDVKYVPTEQDSIAPYEVQTHYLTVAGPDGTAYTTTVTIGVDVEHGAVPLTAPSLLPEPPVDLSFRPEPYPDSTQVSVSDTEAVITAIDQWRSAFSSGDPAILRAYVGDPDSNHAYVPLVGAQLSSVSVGDAYAASAVNADGASSDIFVSITADISWSATPVDPNSTEELTQVSYDLLVTGADTAAPKVVAWGGPGTGPTLKTFGNAVIGRQIEAPDGSTEDGTDITDPDAIGEGR